MELFYKSLNVLLRVKMKVAVKEAGGMDPKYNSKLAKLQAEYQKAGLPMDTFRKKLSQLKDAAV